MTDLVLHEHTEELVAKFHGNLPHALVVDGPSGIGVRAVAEHLAKSMDSPLLVIEPKKSANGQFVVDYNEGNVIIDDIRQLYEQTRAKQPRSFVYILDTGERSITQAAQNAFLKLLEEPRQGLHFIIATHHYDQLLPTIASRTQRLTLLPVGDAQTKQLISDLQVQDATKQARLAFVGRGLPALIKRLASNDKAYESRVAIMGDAKIMISGTPFEKATTTHKYKDDRASALTLLDDMNHQLKVIVTSKPDQSLVALIAKHLEARDKIAKGGNIRLQLLSAVV